MALGDLARRMHRRPAPTLPPPTATLPPERPPIEPSTTCRAPHHSMRFSPGGLVDVCCANDQYSLGRIGEQTVADAWNGGEIARVRQALDEGDYSYGCQDCGNEIEVGNRSTTPATMFDRYPEGVSQWPRRLEFALSNTCNLQCVHCNGDLSSAIRAQREHRPPIVCPYDDAFFEEIVDFLPHLEVAVFIGGEPFLTRECRRLWDLLIEHDLHPEVHVTTNGTIWNDRVEHYVRTLRMRVAVSIDGHTAATNEAIRVGSDHAEVERNRTRFRELVAECGGAFSINHCFMRQNWHELGDFLLAADAYGDRVTLIPVLYPAEDSIFCASADEVDGILATMEASRGTIEAHLGQNRAVWDEALALVRGHARRIAAGAVPVALRARSIDTSHSLAMATADLTTLTGLDPLIVQAEWDTVHEVRSHPAWADVLELDGWIGQPIAALGGLFDHLGTPGELTQDRGRAGTLRTAMTLHRPGGDVTLHSVLINEYAAESFLLVAPSAPLD